MDEVLRAWQDSTSSWSLLEEDDKRARAVLFYETFDLEDILRYCREAPEDSDKTDTHMEGFLRAKLTIAPLSVSEMCAVLRTVDLREPCHKGIVKHLGRTRDTYRGDDRELLADALIELVERSGYPQGIIHQLEVAAVTFSARDALLDRMRLYSESKDETERQHAVSLMQRSIDPRSKQLLLEFAKGFQDRGETPNGRLLVQMGHALGPVGYDLLVVFLEDLGDYDQRRTGLQALAHTGDARAITRVWDEYQDIDAESVRPVLAPAVDSPDERRWYHLWHLCRILEPLLLASVEGDDGVLRRKVLDLWDRASRFGVAADTDTVLKRLRAVASGDGADPEVATRLLEICARFEQRQAEKASRP